MPPSSPSGGAPALLADLGGRWVAAQADDELRREAPLAGYDDALWSPVEIPGSWRATAGPGLSEGPVLYRRRFEAAPLGPGRRAWLVADRVFYEADIWLDGSYLGDAEGWFFPHTFEVTELLTRDIDHVVAMEVRSPASTAPMAGAGLCGVWGDTGSAGANHAGVWGPVQVVSTGPARLRSLRLACQHAGSQRAVLAVSAVVDCSQSLSADVVTDIALESTRTTVASTRRTHPLAPGLNRLHWRVEVEEPELWWPAGTGDQPLYRVAVKVLCGGEASDRAERLTGLRQVRAQDMRWSVNAVPVFLMAAEIAPGAGAGPGGGVGLLGGDEAGEVRALLAAGFNAVRPRGNVAGPEFYEAADRSGLLVLQDLPLVSGSRRSRQQAVRQAGELVHLLGHHPSIVAWGPASCLDGAMAGETERLRPVWKRAVGARRRLSRSLVTSVHRALERADRSRPTVPPAARPSRSGGRGLARSASLWPASARFPVFDLMQGTGPGWLRRGLEETRKLRMHPAGGFLVRVGRSFPLDAATAAEVLSSCGQVLVAAEWPAPAYGPGSSVQLALHVVNETAHAVDGAVVTASVSWPGGGREVSFTGQVAARAVTYVGRLTFRLPGGPGMEAGVAAQAAKELACGAVVVQLRLVDAEGRAVAANSYTSALGAASALAN